MKCAQFSMKRQDPTATLKHCSETQYLLFSGFSQCVLKGCINTYEGEEIHILPLERRHQDKDGKMACILGMRASATSWKCIFLWSRCYWMRHLERAALTIGNIHMTCLCIILSNFIRFRTRLVRKFQKNNWTNGLAI